MAVLAGVVVAGALSASAATLGGVHWAQLGADTAVVAAPISKGVDVTWETAYSQQAKGYAVTGIALAAHNSSESIPTDAQVKLSVTGSGGAVLGEYVSTDGGRTWSTKPAAAILAKDVEGVAVVINGTKVQA
ncbi:MAG: hypothetical protein QM804_12155 [Propionicimonas sp.]